MKKWMLVLLVMLIGMSVPVSAEEDFTTKISVKGTGQVVIEPDLATISFAVKEENKEASAAQSAATEKANAVKAALMEEGLSEEKFAMSAVDLYTEYDYISDYRMIDGYRATITMSIEEIPVDEVGRYLSICSQNGMNEINGVNVFYSGYDEAYNDALKKAMEQAHRKAEIIAESEGVSLTGKFIVDEGYQNSSMRSMTKSYASNAMVMEDSAAVPELDYSAGSSEIEADVAVTYEAA